MLMLMAAGFVWQTDWLPENEQGSSHVLVPLQLVDEKKAKDMVIR